MIKSFYSFKFITHSHSLIWILLLGVRKMNPKIKNILISSLLVLLIILLNVLVILKEILKPFYRLFFARKQPLFLRTPEDRFTGDLFWLCHKEVCIHVKTCHMDIVTNKECQDKYEYLVMKRSYILTDSSWNHEKTNPEVSQKHVNKSNYL